MELFRSNEIAAHLYLNNPSDNEKVDENVYRDYADSLIRAYHYLDENLPNDDERDSSKWMAPFYDIGKEEFGKKGLRTFFKMMYIILFCTEDGSRVGVTAQIMGNDAFMRLFYSRMSNPLMFPN